GARIREYRLEPGESVACTAAPDDSFVVIRLAGPFEGMGDITLDVQTHDLSSGARRSQHVEGVPVDARAREIVLLFPGSVVRGYPRSRCTLEARSTGSGQPARFGPYTLDHTPWEQLPSPS